MDDTHSDSKGGECVEMASHGNQGSCSSSSDDDSDQEDQGFTMPSMTILLKSILDQYPDDGQILKELIQNAEDAGATDVKFLYDDNSYPTKSLHHQKLAKYQGPALYAFNNALFEKDDWKGLRLVQDSIKKKNPMKVGRFGLGFKSVLHMTDLPSVLSGKKLTMIDPSGECGHTWRLKEAQTIVKNKERADQFAPYLRMLGKDTFKAGKYDGTMFRFPLRREASQLSSKLYDGQHIAALLESFEVEAHLVLLFLKKVERIGIHQLDNGSKKPRPLFQLKIADDCVDEVRRKRTEFYEKCKSGDVDTDIHVSYMIHIETIKHTHVRNPTVNHYHWLVTEHKAGSQVSVELLDLCKNEQLSSVPLVGVAMDISGEDRAQQHSLGQVFCHLPLSGEQRNPTGLPVHVNGYFAVSQNRRHLKWPTPEYKAGSDESVDWNQCLLNELLPVIYKDLLLKAIEIHSIPQEMIYAALPDVDTVDEKWRSVVHKLYTILADAGFLYTQAKGGQWISIQDAIFVHLKEDADISGLITDVLLQCDANIVSVPDHVYEALLHYFPHRMTTVTPSTVRDRIRSRSQSYSGRTWDDKLTILKYILTDEEYTDLEGLELLPCADETMTKFHSRNNLIFITSAEVPPELFPGLEHELVATGLVSSITEHLLIMARKGVTQIRLLDHGSTHKLIQRVLPSHWTGNSSFTLTKDTDSITAAWFQHFWRYLLIQHPSDIDSFAGLHVIPSGSWYPMQVFPLSEILPCIVRSIDDICLSVDLAHVLQMFGVYIIDIIPKFVQEHALVLGKYVKQPTDVDILNVLFQSYSQNNDCQSVCKQIREDLTLVQKAALINIITNQSRSIFTPGMIAFLHMLPVFPSICHGKTRYVSIKEVSEATDYVALPCQLSQPFIDVSDKHVRGAIELLGVDVLTVKDVVLKYAVNEINNGHMSCQNTRDLMMYIAVHFIEYKDDRTFMEQLSNCPFVTTEDSFSDTTVKACDLFDPEDQMMAQIFHDQKCVFPSSQYAESVMLDFLRKLGLKNQNRVTDSDICIALDQINIGKTGTSKSKGSALLNIFNNRPELLKTGSKVLEYAKVIPWVPICESRFDDYPYSLKWYAEDVKLGLPSSVQLKKYQHLVGSICAVIDGNVTQVVGDVFNWNVEPSLDDVIKHFKTIIQTMHPDEKAEYLPHIHRIFKYLSNQRCEGVQQAMISNDMDKWVWNGDGFVSVDSIFENGGLPLSNLSPFVHELPNEMIPFLKFVKSMGVQSSCSVERLIKVLREIAQTQEELGQMSKITDKYLALAINILNHLAENIGLLSIAMKEAILAPTDEQADESLKMLPLKECTFCDDAFKSRGFGLSDMDDEDGIILVHPHLPTSTSEILGIPTLISRILSTDDIVIEMFGQHESLTQRIRNLLEEYSDGMAIFKEMIQNADDAGATEVRFMYDERTNAEHCTNLLDKGMQECQGPALWVFNDQVFSDDDFQNIIKLGGATKVRHADKIGRFGLGFNAVYNVTDIPSFISRQYMVIFDPTTKHLGRAIKDKTQPGIKIDLQNNKPFLRRFSNQFYPFNNVFACDATMDHDWYFDGTLFRLPLRTKWQADQTAQDGISPKHYSRLEMVTLLKFLTGHGHDLLLFTQYVKKVSLYHIPEDGDPMNPIKIYSITNTLVPETNMSTQQASTGFLTAVSTYVKSRDTVSAPHICTVVQSKAEIFDHILDLDRPAVCLDHWLITQCSGIGDSLIKARESTDGLIPVAGVAINISKSSHGFIHQKLGDLQRPALKHNTYCFLPLPLSTGFQVHLNGAFAIEASRKHLSLYSPDSTDNKKSSWNASLLSDAGVLAYKQALEKLCALHSLESDTCFYEIWPFFGVEEPFTSLCVAFYHNVDKLVQLPFLTRDGVKYTLEQTLFFSSSNMNEITRACAITAFQQVQPDCVIIPPPDDVVTSMTHAGHQAVISSKLFDIERFYREIFFPNIYQMPGDTRDVLLVYALCDVRLESLIKKERCIPVSPHGKHLEMITHLFDPLGEVAKSKLYTEEDGRFPYNSLVAVPYVLRRLVHLGMEVDNVSWDDLTDRAHSVQQMMDISVSDGDHRLDQVLHFMNKKLTLNQKWDQHVKTTLLTTPFLKVMMQPTNYPFPWKGDPKNHNRLFRPCDLYGQVPRYLVSGNELIADESCLTNRLYAKRFLGLNERNITMDQIYVQLKQILTSRTNKDENGEEFDRGMHMIYKYLDDNINDPLEKIIDLMQTVPSVLVNRTLALPQYVAYNAFHDCAPFLHRLTAVHRHKHLMKKIGVKDEFTEEDCIKMLQDMHKEANGQPLSDIALSASLKIILMLGYYMRIHDTDRKTLNASSGKIYLPDSRGILKSSITLCYNECDWINVTMALTHTDIPQLLCQKLGVETARTKLVRGHSIGLSFGQKERLTTSLRRICESYPRQQVFKELIQNADDAGASEIHFVMDFRTHGKKQLFHDSWKPLQGPALCVYNDGPFTVNDLEGIQRLGEGSKKQDPYRTGQYGVGFSSVYHLTDAPSLFAFTDNTKKMLCIFDPHCKYVPGASPAEPGRRFDNVEVLEKTFSDVFTCYLQTQFDVSSGGCLIRLPLRSATAADHSEISCDAVSTYDIQDMLKRLQEEAPEILLFLKNLKTIIVSNINPHSGVTEEQYSVSLSFSSEQQCERDAFAQKLKSLSRGIRENLPALASAPQHTMIQNVQIKDSLGRCEEWCISQVAGFKVNTELSDTICTAIRNGQFGLIPVGGCAFPLKTTVTKPKDITMKAYCFLPTSETTGLPMHVNGHFALGQENRGQIWSDDKSKELKHTWNELLCSDLIADAFVSILEYCKAYVPSVANVTPATTIRTIEDYLQLFPSCSKANSEWPILAKHVYRVIHARNAKVFPFCKSQKQRKVTWMPVVGTEACVPLFSKTETFAIRNILVKWNACIVESTPDIHDGLQAAGVAANFLTPGNVVQFLKSSPSVLQPLPIHISHTPLCDTETLLYVLNYCIQSQQDRSLLEGLPLLLTQDCQVRMFNACTAVFPPDFRDLLPHSAHLFVHESVWEALIKDEDMIFPPVFTPLSLEDLAMLLDKELSAETFRGTCEVEWLPISQHPTAMWLGRFWYFVWSRKYQHKENTDVVTPLGSWCLLPATIGTKKYLFPVNRGNDIVFTEKPRVNSAEYNIIHVLKMCNVPWLDLQSIRCHTNSHEEAVKHFVTTLDKPDAVLRILQRYLKIDSFLSDDYATAILEYFLHNLGRMQSVTCLRTLPLYRTMNNKFIALNDSTVYVISDQIPIDGIDVFRNRSNIVFLLQNKDFDQLHRSLSCKQLSVLEFYTTFVFQHLEYFKDAMVARHMYYLYDSFIRERRKHEKAPKDFQRTRNRFIDELTDVAFIKDNCGQLQMASMFYSRSEEIFVAVCPDELAPKMPSTRWHSEQSWNTFLCAVGLIQNVSKTLFVKFVQRVAREARVSVDKKIVVDKSKALTKYLLTKMKMDDLDSIIQETSDVEFVVRRNADDELIKLCPQHGHTSNQSVQFITYKGSVSGQHEDIVWTNLPLLSNWADPLRARWQSPNKERIMRALLIENPPSAEMVSSNMVNVIQSVLADGIATTNKKTLLRIFRATYKYFSDIDILSDEIHRRLCEERGILTTNQENLVLPCKTVINLPLTDEIKPYLYRVPLDIAEYATLFQRIGSTDTATADQYITVLSDIKQSMNNEVPTPNDVLDIQKAMVGLFGILESSGWKDVTANSLLLPDENGHLSDVRQLIFNDSPAYYTRLQGQVPFVADVKECGLKVTTVMKIFKRLPKCLRPEFLSECVTENLVEMEPLSTENDGLMYDLDQKIKSPEFGEIVLRLLYHEALTSQEKVEEQELRDLVERLSVVSVYGVKKVRTQLRYRNIIPQSEIDKLCFKRKVKGHKAGMSTWQIYIQNDCSLQLDLLVPLAEIIDSIVDGRLRKSALYLMHVLQSDQHEMPTMLDAYNITDDHSRPSLARALLPSLGIPVSESHMAKLSPVTSALETGRYVGYRESPDDDFVYGIVKDIMTDGYLLDIGRGNTIRANADQLQQL